MSNYLAHPHIVFRYHNFIDPKNCALDFDVALRLESVGNLSHIKTSLEIDGKVAVTTFITMKDAEKFTFEFLYRNAPPSLKSGSGAVVFDLDLKKFVCVTHIKSNMTIFDRDGKEFSFKDIAEKESVRIGADLHYVDNHDDFPDSDSDDDPPMSPEVSGVFTCTSTIKPHILN
jgi:hypothetical protein